jgi:PAS domain S-box-containing protein
LFSLFLMPSDQQSRLLEGHHQLGLMLLSILIAVLASIFALQQATLARSAPSRIGRDIALYSGAGTLAGGIWAMHFIGMLSFQLPLTVGYDPLLTMVSVLPALLASVIALRILSAPKLTLLRIALGGVSVGAGIGVMHYTGMFAMQMDATLYYDPLRFAISILVAIGMAMFALWIHYGVRRALNLSTSISLILAGTGMGGAIASMHYTGMAAAQFVATEQAQLQMTDANTLLAFGIGFTVLALTLLVAASNGAVRYRDLHRQVRNSEVRVRAILDTAVDGIITLDDQGLIQSYNPAAETLFGWTAAEVIGRNVRILMPDPFRNEHDQYLHNYLRSSEARIIGTGREVMALRKDGSQFPIRLGVGETTINNKPLFVGFVTDITKRKLLEDSLKSAKEEAEKAADIKSAFLANMSHEIRTPMNAIIGFSELLLDTPMDETQYRHSRTIHRSARSLLRLLNDILDSAKLDRGAIELEQVPFSLRSLCDETIEVLQLQATAKGISLQLNFRPDQDLYLGDPFRLSQILLNLMSNAVKFTESGTVQLDVSRDDNEQLIIAVIDEGIGIAPDRIDTIFEPFSQADASMSRRFGGTGLGTSIAMQLAKLMGGDIEIDSTLDVGSTFTVRLPLPAAKAAADHSVITTRITGRLRVLAVDDVPENLELLQLTLRKNGHQVDTAENGEQAVALFKQATYDVILMDVQMPVMDGLQATRAIRQYEQQHQRPATPVIALTASVMDRDRQSARDAGMNGFATKPLEWQALNREINHLVTESGINVELGATPVPEPENTERNVKTGSMVFNEAVALRRWGSKQSLDNALSAFISKHKALTDMLHKLANANDTDKMITLLHKAKGSAANLGLERLANACNDLEQNCQQSSIDASSVDVIEKELDAVAHQITDTESDVTKTDPAAANATTIDIATIERLIDALQRGEVPDALVSDVRQMLAENQRVRLNVALDEFDFESASALLQSVVQEHLDEHD